MAQRIFRRNKYNPANFKKLDSESCKYIPLFGIWLIDMALILDWYQSPSFRQWPEIFSDNDFCSMTGMTPIDDDSDDDEKPKRITASRCRKILVKQREQLQKMKLSPSLPLFKTWGC